MSERRERKNRAGFFWEDLLGKGNPVGGTERLGAARAIHYPTLLFFVALFFPLFAAVSLSDEPAWPSKWTKEQIVLETSYQVLNAIDWRQAIDISRREDEGYWEINPLLGKHPSSSRVNGYFALSTLAHVGIAHLLPDCWRTGFLILSNVVKVGLVAKNVSIGLRVRF